jgi:hypothetical protein
MSLGNDMVNLMRNKGRVVRYSAILAAISGACDDFTA